MHEVSNPWPNLPDEPAYVLGIDQPSVNDWNQYVRSQQRFNTDGYFIHTELLPEPFVGNLTTAAVFLLMLNPGYSPDDHDVHERCDFQQMVRSVHCQDVDCINYYLVDNMIGTPGGDYWQIRTKNLQRELAQRTGMTAEDAMRRVAEKICILQFYPYHTARYNQCRTAPNMRVPSQRHTCYLLQQVLNRRSIVLVMRSRTLWSGCVPSLNDLLDDPTQEVYQANNPRSPYLTSGNLGQTVFDRVVEAICPNGR